MRHRSPPGDAERAAEHAVARIWAEPPRNPRPGIDWWIWCVPLVVALHVTILVALEARLGRIGVVLWSVGPPLLIVMIAGLLVAALLSSIRRRDSWTRWRLLGYAGLLAVAATLPVYETYPSSYDDHPSAVDFRLPLDGNVTVVWGGESVNENYHAVLADQRWAYDLLITRDGRSHAGDGSRLTDYYGYDRPVHAPAGGIVRAVRDGEPDKPIDEAAGGRIAAGNHVVIEVVEGEYLVLAHLRPGSIAVSVGDRVDRGQVMARVGNSGNTSEPHVHLHLQDTLELQVGEGIPFFFHDYVARGVRVERGMPRGGLLRGRFVGDVVRQAGGS